MKFVHLANVELGAKGPAIPRISVDFPKARLEDFQKALNLCRTEKADALLITGNLFGSVPTEEDLKMVDGLLSECVGLKTVILPGLKDGVVAGCAYTTYQWESNTTVFAGDCIQRVYIKKLNCEITGCGYCEETWSKVRPELMARGKKGAIQILLLPFLGKDDGEVSFETADTFAFPADYAGIGQRVLIAGPNGSTTYSPGTMEPEFFTDKPQHGCYLVDIEAKGQKVSLHTEFRLLSSKELLTIKVSAHKALTYEDTEKQIRDSIVILGGSHIYKILLQGEASPSLYMKRDHLFEIGNIVEIKDETDRDATIEDLKDEGDGTDVIALFLKGLADVGDDDVRKKAMEFGVEALLRKDAEDEQ